MAVRGYNEPGGDFLVSDVCFAGLAPQAPLPSPPSGAEDKYVALLSGLHLGSSRADALRTQLLVDMLTGALGSRGDQKMSAKVRGEGRSSKVCCCSVQAASMSPPAASALHQLPLLTDSCTAVARRVCMPLPPSTSTCQPVPRSQHDCSHRWLT